MSRRNIEAKTYLGQITRKRAMIATLEAQIVELEELVHSPLKGVTYDRDVVQTSHTGSGGNGKVEELVDRQARLKSMKTSLMNDIDHIRDEIWQISNNAYMEFLSIVYLEGQSIQYAADRMGMTYDRGRHVHGEALLEFQRTILDPRAGSEG